MNMIESIPSADVTAYTKETGWVFSDWDQASILFNLCPSTLQEKASRLRELCGRTQDPVLVKQIAQRLALEEETREVFFRNTPGMFYMAAACEDDAVPLGYYAGAEDAVRRGKQDGGAFEVYKYRLLGTPNLPPLRKNQMYLNPYLFQEEPPSEEPEPFDDDSDQYWAGCASFNERGDLCAVVSNEMLSVGEAVQVELAFSPRRFENRYVELPNPFQRGDIVQVAGAGNRRRGVVETSQEEWAQFNRRVKDGLYVDFSDACITVEFPTENGFSHSHISPLYLERCRPEKGDSDYDILQAGSDMLQGRGGLEYFTYTCQKYRERS